MDIGGALAEARSEAGLTITQVSERTRIRATIIRDIEHDDYSACGGDFYARGHIRAIARVVGTDPVPLIEEYDAAHMAPASMAEPGRTVPGRAAPGSADPDADTNPDLLDGEALEFGLPGALFAGLRLSVVRWTAAVRAKAAAAVAAHRADTTPLRPPVLTGISAADAFRPGLPLKLRRRRPGRNALVALIALIVIGALIYLLASGGSSHDTSPATRRPHNAAAAAHHAGGTAAAASRPASAASSGATRPAVSGPLTVASAAAFGPGGTGQGDDPQQAQLAIDGKAGTAWHTAWYTTAKLGGLQPGTGLLLGLGKTVTIASATIVLGTVPGGTIELRAGPAPALADLAVVARAANPGGALTVHLSSPVTARYVLIWFTSLPPDQAGTYQASIYNVRLSGAA